LINIYNSYVGGFYGGCDEESMMKEIYENGPIIVAINATPELYYYSKGIFHSDAKKTEGTYEKNVKPWEFTNHAIVCLGWGEETVDDNVVKYWILKNSWGESWGENGYFKLTKGSNMASVEAQGVYLIPDLE
jgi:cathepsin C